MKLPWRTQYLHSWRIATMHHYQAAGAKGGASLFVIMTKGKKFIKHEGLDDLTFWKALDSKAFHMFQAENHETPYTGGDEI
ncbi:MAG: hypothetical protein H8D23_37320 [Candidatus Brocadiales bacterium]|nr:hypothetical protein [Candidatus Brocadiales bacterium]